MVNNQKDLTIGIACDLNRTALYPQQAADWARDHVNYITQGPEADNAWSTFVLDNSQGFTAPGVEHLNNLI